MSRSSLATSRAGLAAVVTALLVAGGCHSSDPRQAIAERFIDALYIRIDQPSARELATGLAASKIDEEIRLKAGQAIDESTRQPTIHYTFVQFGGSQGESASLVYDLHVAPDGADSFTQRLILTLRQDAGAWRVANYTLESPPVPG
jgi:hypothetical protein